MNVSKNEDKIQVVGADKTMPCRRGRGIIFTF